MACEASTRACSTHELCNAIWGHAHQNGVLLACCALKNAVDTFYGCLLYVHGSNTFPTAPSCHTLLTKTPAAMHPHIPPTFMRAPGPPWHMQLPPTMGDVANKDEALKCLDIAKAALSAGDRERALKFSLKAERLYKSPQVGGWVHV